jgi:hypothetical protein
MHAAQADVSAILAEEREEADLRKAEMEAAKVWAGVVRLDMVWPLETSAARHGTAHPCTRGVPSCQDARLSCWASSPYIFGRRPQAANLMEHEDEIFSRPKRTWFATAKEKAAARERSRQAVAGQGEEDEGGEDGDVDEGGAGGKKVGGRGRGLGGCVRAWRWRGGGEEVAWRTTHAAWGCAADGVPGGCAV